MDIDYLELTSRSKALGRYIADCMSKDNVALNRYPKGVMDLLGPGIIKYMNEGYSERMTERRMAIDGKI